MQKKWILKEQAEAGKIDELAESANISKPLANLLLQRGINDSESARKFFHPDLQQLYDPFLMKDMDKAVARLEKAIIERENVLIYGDYDVDGTTAVAMMYVFLKASAETYFTMYPTVTPKGTESRTKASTMPTRWAANLLSLSTAVLKPCRKLIMPLSVALSS